VQLVRPHPLGGKPGVDFAGDELRHYVRQISECELPLAQDGSAAKTTTIGLREDLDPVGEALLPDEADGYSLAIVAGRKARSVIGGAAPPPSPPDRHPESANFLSVIREPGPSTPLLLLQYADLLLQVFDHLLLLAVHPAGQRHQEEFGCVHHTIPVVFRFPTRNKSEILDHL